MNAESIFTHPFLHLCTIASDCKHKSSMFDISVPTGFQPAHKTVEKRTTRHPVVSVILQTFLAIMLTVHNEICQVAYFPGL